MRKKAIYWYEIKPWYLKKSIRAAQCIPVLLYCVI